MNPQNYDFFPTHKFIKMLISRSIKGIKLACKRWQKTNSIIFLHLYSKDPKKY